MYHVCEAGTYDDGSNTCTDVMTDTFLVLGQLYCVCAEGAPAMKRIPEKGMVPGLECMICDTIRRLIECKKLLEQLIMCPGCVAFE